MSDAEVAAEQAVLDMLYGRLDGLRTRAAEDLERSRRSGGTGTPASRTEREAFVRMYADRLATLDAAEERLCFGRLDLDGGTIRHIGRVGLSDDDQQPLLTDWRAPAAEPFYQATAADRRHVIRRRHILSSRRRVTSLEDDVLDLAAVGTALQPSTVEGGGALMAALAATRTGRMHDIVATIQAEQDRIIRAPIRGILVVDGPPGCGKTVVALHRAAYLLYTHRERLARDGVLIIGPNPLFLRYISQVLPALGETSAILTTMGTLVPGIEATAEDDDDVATLKGDLRMVQVMLRAVRRRQRALDAPRRLEVAGTVITMSPQMVSGALERARASRKPHNEARRTFVLSLLDRLVTALAAARRVDVDSQRDILIEDLRDSRDVRREVNLCWMPLTPEGLLRDLWSDESEIAQCAAYLTPTQVRRLIRPRSAAWTVSDVPLLDELAELLGRDDEQERTRAAAEAAARRAEVDYARSVLEMTGQGEAMTADMLVDRYASDAARLTVAERASADREWTYGHVVIDEAQELTPMAWHSVMRRCPSRSMTIVGDLDQRRAGAGTTSWEKTFTAYAPARPDGTPRWQVETLTVNYRTPQPLMNLAGSILLASGIAPRAVTSARDGEPPRYVHSTADDTILAEVRRELAIPSTGRLAVIAAAARADLVHSSLAAALGGDVVGHGLTALDRPVSVLTVQQAKGLEFDAVILVEPEEIRQASARGAADLYVAVTRATTRLVIAWSRDLPPGFDPPAGS